MADIELVELVIKLDKELYDEVMALKYGTRLEKAIQNGKLLPKGHGIQKDTED